MTSKRCRRFTVSKTLGGIVACISSTYSRQRMSRIPETVDLEVQIEALINKAEDVLRQQTDDIHRDHDAATAGHTLRRSPPAPHERLTWWRWLFK
jgi:hypothetical protein